MGLRSSDERPLHEGYRKREIWERVLKLQARMDIFDRFCYDDMN